MDKNLIQRTVSGVVYCFIITFCTTALGANLLHGIFPGVQQDVLFYALMTFLMLVSAWECINVMQFSKQSWQRYAVFPIVLLVYYRFSKRFFEHGFNFNFNLSEVLALSLIAIATVTLFRFNDELKTDAGKLIFTVIYTVLPYSFALGLPSGTGAAAGFSPEVFMLFLLIWASDTFAYLMGKFFGRHKMAPNISPKKTWEGFAGGVVLTLIFAFFIEKYFPDLRGNWLVVGFLVSIFAPLGDLVESQLKRTFGAKDSGKIIPGHGGVLDRLDSFMICAPVVYLYFILDRLL